MNDIVSLYMHEGTNYGILWHVEQKGGNIHEFLTKRGFDRIKTDREIDYCKSRRELIGKIKLYKSIKKINQKDVPIWLRNYYPEFYQIIGDKSDN